IIRQSNTNINHPLSLHDALPISREGRGMIQATGIDHLVLHVGDVARAKKFYTEVLGMTVYRENDRQVFLHAGSQGVALFRKQEEDRKSTRLNSSHVSISYAVFCL